MSGRDPRQEWCDQARAIVGAGDANALDYQRALRGAEDLITTGKPPEFTDEDWAGIEHYLGEAREGFKTKSGLKNTKKKLKSGKDAPPSEAQVTSFKLLKQAMNQIVEETNRKRIALDEVKTTHDLATLLDAEGLAAIAQLDAPAAAIKSVTEFNARNAAAIARITRQKLTKLVDMGVAQARSTEIEGHIRALRLGEAQAGLVVLDAVIQEAADEQVAMRATVGALPDNDTAKNDFDKVRKLTALLAEFAAIKAGYEAVIAAVRKTSAKDVSKMSQCLGIEKDFGGIFTKWEALSTADKLANNGAISVDRLKTRLASVGKLPDPAVAEKTKADQGEWAAFRKDVDAKWKT